MSAFSEWNGPSENGCPKICSDKFAAASAAIAANTAAITVLNTKTDTTNTNVEADAVDITEAKTDIAAIQAALGFSADYTALDTTIPITTTQYYEGKLKAEYNIDFVKWSTVNALYVGTFGTANNVYVLGQLSDEWLTPVLTGQTQKSSRIYLKYVNTHPFDAIIDITATSTADENSASLSVHISKESNAWTGLKFYVLHATDANSKPVFYLGFTSDGVSAGTTGYLTLTFYVAGENFIAGTSSVQGTGQSVAITASVPDDVNNATVLSTVAADILLANEVNTLTNKQIYKYDIAANILYVGDTVANGVNKIVYNQLPYYTTDGGVTTTHLSTVADEVPLGAMLRWPTGVTLPAGYLSCDGTTIPAIYTALIALLGTTTTPIETDSIIKAVPNEA